MLQRRIGMICTSSGCAVCVRPRTNSLRERALRLMLVLRGNPKIIASGGGRLGGPHAPDALADLQRAGEDRPDWNEPEQLMPDHRGEAGRRHTAAVAAVRRAAELARRD